MAAEEVQEIGRKGVAILKRWLEATTYMELPYDAYNHRIDCTMQTLSGTKALDLAGRMLTGNKEPVFVESKRYKTSGGQYQEYKKFLCIAYSATVKEIEDFGDTRSPLFYWVTFHPFNLENWSKLETFEFMKAALEEHPEYLGGRDVDLQLVFDVSSRVTVLVFNEKQEALSLTRDELETIRRYLNRKANEV